MTDEPIGMSAEGEADEAVVASLLEKLHAWSADLPPEERRVLGALLLQALPTDDVTGFGGYHITANPGLAVLDVPIARLMGQIAGRRDAESSQVAAIRARGEAGSSSLDRAISSYNDILRAASSPF